MNRTVIVGGGGIGGSSGGSGSTEVIVHSGDCEQAKRLRMALSEAVLMLKRVYNTDYAVGRLYDLPATSEMDLAPDREDVSALIDALDLITP